jgi:hypothetical protein
MDVEASQRRANRRALMREVNERILEINDEFHSNEPVHVVCEFRRAECVEMVRIGHSVYERVRRQPARYTVAADHEEQKVERVVQRRSRCTVVEAVSSGGPG